jgi:hypothetical protein
MVARIVGYLSPRNPATLRRISDQTDNCAANSVGALVKITDVPSDSNAKPETLGPRCEQPATILRSATIAFCGLNRAFRLFRAEHGEPPVAERVGFSQAVYPNGCYFK